MENSLNILNELNQISPVIAGIEKVNVFTVPMGYFECLGAAIITGINIENDPKSENFSDSSSYDIPAGYFNNLADTVLQRIKMLDADDASAELRTLSSMLYSIQNENVFEVPKGYFESLSSDVLDKVLLKQPKIIVMRRRSTTFFKYAIAAAFTGVIVLAVFTFTGKISPEVKLPAYVAEGMKLQNVDEALYTISDADIIKYLKSNPENIDAQMVANKTLDENDLPSQVDYLMDEKALDNYLDNINVKDLSN